MKKLTPILSESDRIMHQCMYFENTMTFYGVINVLGCLYERHFVATDKGRHNVVQYS